MLGNCFPSILHPVFPIIPKIRKQTKALELPKTNLIIDFFPDMKESPDLVAGSALRTSSTHVYPDLSGELCSSAKLVSMDLAARMKPRVILCHLLFVNFLKKITKFWKRRNQYSNCFRKWLPQMCGGCLAVFFWSESGVLSNAWRTYSSYSAWASLWQKGCDFYAKSYPYWNSISTQQAPWLYGFSVTLINRSEMFLAIIWHK